MHDDDAHVLFCDAETQCDSKCERWQATVADPNHAIIPFMVDQMLQVYVCESTYV